VERRGIRINRYLAMCGLGARRAVEGLVSQGRVEVNGEAVRDLSFRVAPGAAVTVDGEPVEARRRFRYVAYYKSRGVLTTARDPFGRKTYGDELPPRLRNLKAVGRLDADTEGLLILTDDGALAQKVAHPSFGVVKRYVVTVTGGFSDEAAAALAAGVELDDGHVAKMDVEAVAKVDKGSAVTLSVTYGRKRMIRRAFAALGHDITSLLRVSVGPVALDELAPGEWRDLTPEEVAALRDA
jgi:23S rRNA pseudouridine2605 synthase